MSRSKIAACVLILAAALACSVNPVTGRKEFMLYSESQEIELGKQPDASKINRSPKRLTLAKANGSDTLQAIFKKTGAAEKSWPQLAIINGLELSAVPAAGRLVKTVKSAGA